LCGALTSANTNERDVAGALSEAVDGDIVLCDGGYRSAPLGCSVAEEAELLITPQGPCPTIRRMLHKLCING